VHDTSAVTTYLFTDIEGSTGHWEREPERMRAALAQHDAIAQARVTAHRGTVVKTTGDGIHAVFADPLDAVRAAVALQLALAAPDATNGIALRVRCGLHAGVDERRDNDYFGNAVNRAARVMTAAHGGQILVSQAVAALVADRLPKDIALLDLGQVRLRGLAQLEQVCQVVHPSLQQQFPALRSLAETPNNLPQQLTTFVAREHELAEVAGLLGETRLLTLLGGGGFGKTRLSLQVAAKLLDDYPDGVWLVELAPVGDPRLVPQAVASMLGVKEDPGFPVLDALLTFARERRFLLVLDNCEHVVHACAELARQMLEGSAGVTILASSREPLNIRGERTYPLAPLTAPAPTPTLRADAIAAFSAVQLFADRAAAAQPSFRITDDNAAAVAEICHRLDGIPLALELAAARLRSMPVERIAERLSDRFRLLTSGDRTALPRQQTLRALIDWSYDLLDERERMLFRRLAVFAGGFTLDAAEKVGADGAVGEADALDLLARLVEKSLVTLDAAGERYRMLETVRQYALERLAASGEAEAARSRHLAFYVALAERARPEIIGPRQREWLARLDQERENIVAAHAWCARADHGGELDLRLVRAVRNYCFYRGLLAMGLAATTEALALPGAQTRNHARCCALSDAGQFATRMGRHDEALAYLNDSLAIARELGDLSRVAIALQPLGQTYLALDKLDDARAHLAEALTLAREIDNPREIVTALSSLVQLHRVEGAFEAAEPLCESYLVLARKLKDRESTAFGLLNLAMVAVMRRDPARAMNAVIEALPMIEDVGSRPIGQCLLETVAGLVAAREEWHEAARFYGAAEREAAASGLRRDRADEAFLSEQVAKARAALGPDAFSRSEQQGRALDYDRAMEAARKWVESAASPGS
jgi:predicted ATPase/class 3 adenylate cyclase